MEQTKQDPQQPEKEYKEGTFKMGRCTITITRDGADKAWHLSISTPSASPSYKEIKAARYKYLPDGIYMAQIFPPKDEFINLHPYCHHLWQVNINNPENTETNDTIDSILGNDGPAAERR